MEASRMFLLKLKIIILFIVLTSCNQDSIIIKLLNSDDKNEIIIGAYKAGESMKKKFVPLLLKNSDDVRTSTNIKFKGISVYKAKMIALRKIFKVSPPKEITNMPDSTIIYYFSGLHSKSSGMN